MQLGSKTRTVFGLTLGIIAGLALILLPGIVVLNTHPTTATNQHVMVPFTTYEELHSFILTKSCNSTEVRNLYNPTPAPVIPDTTTNDLRISGLSASFTTAAGASTSATPSHSQTNAQVAGVDELDTVKNDGTYIYTVTNNTVAIVLAYPVTDAKLLAHVSVNGSLQGIFVDGNRLVVVSQQYQQYPLLYTGTVQPATGGSIAVYPIFLNYPQTTSLSIFDISDHASPLLTTTLVVNGTLAGARLIGDYAYLVATQPVYCTGPIVLPLNVVNGQALTTGIASVYHSDIADVANSFTTVVGINVTQADPTPAAKIFLIGTSSNIYVSLHQIYLTQPIWSQVEQTAVHRISIDGASISYQATGTVSGHVLNQFSMDEFNGNFRIATTGYSFDQVSTGGVSSSYVQQTNLYVLDSGLHIIGRLEGLSPGEMFYAARFMGDRAYLVTFQRMDPLFVIGLQDPTQPKVLGQLNIPGVSDYLQPYDETHLIGFGKSSTNVTWENAALFQGLKLSLFDVTDPGHPIDTSDYFVGDRGSDSPDLTDHKSVLFDRSLNLLVIPLSIAQAQPNATCTWCYNLPLWQGAYVFNVTVQDGIVFRGGITHLATGQLPSWNNSSFFVTRALYIGSVLYTISNNTVKMNSLSDLTELNSVSLA